MGRVLAGPAGQLVACGGVSAREEWATLLAYRLHSHCFPGADAVKKIRSLNGKPEALPPIWPNEGVRIWYQQQLDALINQAAASLAGMLSTAWAKAPPIWKGSHITSSYGDAAPMMQAAGVAFFSSGKVLLMNRTDGEGWAFPGGRLEPNESYEAAARREAFEETLHAYNGPLDPYRMQEWRGVNFATYLAVVLEEFTPQLNSEHNAFAWVTPRQALKMPLHEGVRMTLEAKYAALAEDAPSATKALQMALAKWGSQTIARFDLMSKSIAADFAARNQRATQAAMMGQLKAAGFTVKFKPTRSSIDAYQAVAAENIGLIKSIAAKYHTDVEQQVWTSVRNGGDLHTLSVNLRKTYGVTVRRAALIARDQNAKAKAVMERVRQMEVGFRRGIWLHSHAGREPRPTHVKMDKQPYKLEKGFYDTDEGEWVHPGQLINCRCSMRPILEGFGE